MKPDVTLNGLSMSGLGWLRESISFPTPESQTNTIIVPGRNSPIRYTEALGRVSYQPRSFQITLSMLGSRPEFNQAVSRAANQLAGRLAEVVLSEEPELYCVGTIQLAPAYDPKTGKGTLSISCEDGDAYRYHTEVTVVTVGSGTAVLTNDYIHDKITAIRAEGNNTLVFLFKDGTQTVKRWADRSRSESWTPEMKAAAREYARKGWKIRSCQQQEW